VQVRFNQESTERQYNLASKAQSLGWSSERIRILDRDLGQSGARTTNREDFKTLVSDVAPFGLAFVFLKERLLDLIVNACEPIFRTNGTVPKMSRLLSKLAGFLLGSPQLERKLVCEIHGSRAVFLRHIGCLLQQGKDGMAGVIGHDSGIRAILLRGECNNSSPLGSLDAHHYFLPHALGTPPYSR
jgi:hypothetical protein